MAIYYGKTVQEAIENGLKEEGIEEGKNLTVKVNNADADMGTASQIAQSFVTDNVDLICAIATPSAQAAYNAAMEKGIPVVYTAVTDPPEPLPDPCCTYVLPAHPGPQSR